MIRSDNKPVSGNRFLRVAGLTMGGIFLVVLFAFVFGYIVQYLWNWMMPGLFGFKTITFLQAFALIIMFKILFSGFGHHPSSRHVHDFDRGRFDGHFPRRWPDGFSSDERRYFREFWEAEGKSAFSDYIKRVGNSGKPDERTGERP